MVDPSTSLAVAVVHLRPAGEPGPDRESRVVVGDGLAQLLDVVWLLGAGTDNAHVAAQDVPRLRQLIKMQAAEHRADLRDPRIVLAGPLQLLARTHTHRFGA